LALSHLAAGRGKAAYTPAATRPHCILRARDLGMLAFVFGLRRWSTSFGCVLVVYHRIEQISRLVLACADPLGRAKITEGTRISGQKHKKHITLRGLGYFYPKPITALKKLFRAGAGVGAGGGGSYPILGHHILLCTQAAWMHLSW